MTLETQRLVIRDFTPADAEALQEILGDRETMAFCEPPYDLAQTTRFLTEFCIGRRGGLAAVEKTSGRLIGYLLFKETEPRVWEMGWFFHRAFWGRGYGYEGCQALLSYGFRQLGARKIFAETIDSGKSLSLMKKLGMELTEVRRRETRDLEGNRADLYLSEITREEWL